MQIGSFTVEVLSEGRFEIFDDGHINRSSQANHDDHKGDGNSSAVGINPILIKSGAYNILLDSGLGWGLDTGSSYGGVSNIRTNLEIFGLEPTDITHVILSHLHYDHAAGCSYNDSEHKTRATFPHATYYVHEKEWDFALSEINSKQKRAGAQYELDDFYRLIADERVELLTENSTEIVNGINTVLTGGHTPGHQITIINSGGNFAYYLGDLLPSSDHLNHYAMEQLDTDPIEAKKRKVQLLRSAFEQKAYLFFYHAEHSQVGSLDKDDDKKYVLKDIKEN